MENSGNAGLGVQLMRHEADEEPLVVDCGMRAARIAWNSNGTVLAVSGTLPPGTTDGKGDAKETPAVQFYSNQGKLPVVSILF